MTKLVQACSIMSESLSERVLTGFSSLVNDNIFRKSYQLSKWSFSFILYVDTALEKLIKKPSNFGRNFEG